MKILLVEDDTALREALEELLLREVFANVEWAQLDRGSKTEATALESIRQRIPAHLVPAAEQLLFRWDDPLVPIPGMYELVEELKAIDSHSLTLEVRASNAPAIALYERFGFAVDGIRKNYYKNPTENAVLMTLSLS